MSLPDFFEQAVDGDAMMQHVANHHYAAQLLHQEEAEDEGEDAAAGAIATVAKAARGQQRHRTQS